MFDSVTQASISTSSGDSLERVVIADTQGKCSKAQRAWATGGNPGFALTAVQAGLSDDPL